MKMKKLLLGMFLLFVAAASRAEVVVLAKTGTIAGPGISSVTYEFDVALAGLYSATLTDNEFLVPFGLLAAGITKTGGPLVGSITHPGTFNLGYLNPGSYSAVVFGQPESAPYASIFGINVSMIPEPQVWVMLGIGLALVTWQRMRRTRQPLV